MNLPPLTRILVLQTEDASKGLRETIQSISKHLQDLVIATSAQDALDHLADDDKYDIVVIEQAPLSHPQCHELLNAIADAYSRVLLLAKPGQMAQSFPSRITVHGLLEGPADPPEIVAMIKEVLAYRPKPGAKQRASSMNQALVKRQSASAAEAVKAARSTTPAPTGGAIRPQTEPRLGVYGRMNDDSELPPSLTETRTSDRQPVVPREPEQPPVSDALPVQPSEQARLLADSVGVAPPDETRSQGVARHRTPEPRKQVASGNTGRRVAPKLPGKDAAQAPSAGGATADPFATPSGALPPVNDADPFATSSSARPAVDEADPFATNSASPPIRAASSGAGRSKAPPLPGSRAAADQRPSPAITPLPIDDAEAQRIAAAAPTVMQPSPRPPTHAQPARAPIPAEPLPAQPLAQDGHAAALGVANLAGNLLRPSGMHAAQWNLPTNQGEFGDFAIMEQLGAGAMGVVYLAYHRPLQVHVALKVLQPAFAGDPEYIARFYREARECAKLDHPNIVRVINVGSLEGHHFIALQYVDGPTVHHILHRDGPLDLSVAVDYAIQLLAGLAYAHSKHCIHRDIKPVNLMITQERVLKITDFGLSRNMAHETALTRTGVMMGTPGYMPLEQWDAHSVDHRADLFAAGVSIYEMLTGRLPYPGDTPTQILRAMILGKPTPLVQYRRDCQPSLVAIVMRLLAQRPEDRYQHAAEAVFALRDWERQNGIERVGNTPSAQIPALHGGASASASASSVTTDSTFATSVSASASDASTSNAPISAHFTTPPPAFSSSAPASTSSRSRAPALPGSEPTTSGGAPKRKAPPLPGETPPDEPTSTNNSGLIPEPVPNPHRES